MLTSRLWCSLDRGKQRQNKKVSSIFRLEDTYFLHKVSSIFRLEDTFLFYPGAARSFGSLRKPPLTLHRRTFEAMQYRRFCMAFLLREKIF